MKKYAILGLSLLSLSGFTVSADETMAYQELFNRDLKPNGDRIVRYALYDIDDNGTDELIAETDGQRQLLYYLKEGSPTYLAQNYEASTDGYRSFFAINKNQTITHFEVMAGSSNADYKVYRLKKDNTAAEVIEKKTYNLKADRNSAPPERVDLSSLEWKSVNGNPVTSSSNHASSPKNQTEESTSSSSSKSDNPKTNPNASQALWNQEKAEQLANYMVEFGNKMGQPGYKSYAPGDDDDFFGVMSFTEQDRIVVGERAADGAELTNERKVTVAFSNDGLGTADYNIVASYGVVHKNFPIFYHFTIHEGQPVVLVSRQNQGNPERLYYMNPTNNTELRDTFAAIVEGR